MIWTRFYDMHSGGSSKTRWDVIYVQAESEADAIARFKHHTDKNPEAVACTCCGQNFSIIPKCASLEESSKFDRGEYEGSRRPVQSMDDFRKNARILILPLEVSP
jgi:hypothetical protein